MSLINQMLKDLDARHEEKMRGRLHREVRALPPAASRSPLRIVLALLAAAGLAAGGWWGYEQMLAGDAEVAVAVAPPAAPPTPAPATQSVEAADQDVARVVDSGSLKLSAMLERLPAEEPRRAASSVKRGEERRNEVKPSPAPAPREAASTASTNVIEKSPVVKTARERSELEYRKAIALVNGARPTEAVDILLDVLREDGGHVASRQLLARLLVEQRRLEEARAILAEGLLAQPGQTAWAMMLARLQVESGDLAGAVRSLQRSESYAAGNADYQGFYGNLLHRLGQHREAVLRYQNATRVAPADGRWWLGLGLALEADHRGGEAREAFLRARSTGNLAPDLAVVVDQKLR